MTFNYITPLLDRAGEGTLNEEDVWDLPPGFKHGNLFRKFLRVESEHDSEVTSKDKKMSLLWFLIWSNSQDLLIDLGIKTLLAFAGECSHNTPVLLPYSIVFVNPFQALYHLIVSLESSPHSKTTHLQTKLTQKPISGLS